VLDLAIEPAGSVAADDGNLVVVAARALAEKGGIEAGARLRLIKGIPVAGGLGGGSADAAAALVLLDRLWRLGLGRTRLHRLAAGLGADVPFFLRGGLALGVGRGDEVYPQTDLEELAVVATAPKLEISTAEVFERYPSRLTWDRQEATVYAFAAGLRRRLGWRHLYNDLEGTVVGGWPEVGEGLRVLRASGPLHAGLSGSGAASYAVFDDPEAARRVAARLPDGWWVHVGTTLSRRAAQPKIAVEE
jgi:4-diphosphocytidyl-2-C-methyl-D-erythritol kinase